MSELPQAEQFQQLLLAYSQEPDADERRRIEESIHEIFGVERAVLVLDMSGFSELSQRYGIVHYLSMVHRMQVTAEPIVTSFRGSVVKFEADNCFAVFPDSLDAIHAAVSLNLAFDAENILVADDLDIHIACGIDYGEVLLLDGRDFFGNAVNRASKLGEDIAHAGEILVTREAMNRVDAGAGIEFTPLTLAISGIEIDACALRYRPED